MKRGSQDETILNKVEARQGENTGLIFVLAIGLTLAVLAGMIVYLVMFA